MKSEDLRTLLTELLPETDLNMRGWVNYSGLDVLSESENGYYLLGLNPGIDDSNVQLSKFEPQQHSKSSAYTGSCWKKHTGGVCVCNPITPNVHQQQVISLAKLLGIPIEKMFGTNAFFIESQGETELITKALERMWSQHWKVHQNFLAEMRPGHIICLGNGPFSSFALLKSVAKEWNELSEGKGWKACSAVLPIFEQEPLRVRIVGLPHPSRPRLHGELVSAFAAYKEWLITSERTKQPSHAL